MSDSDCDGAPLRGSAEPYVICSQSKGGKVVLDADVALRSSHDVIGLQSKPKTDEAIASSLSWACRFESD